MTVVYPDGSPTLGTTKLTIATAVADMTQPKLATEINAASSVEVSGYLYPAGWAPTANQGKGTAPARLASKSQAERLNRVTRTMGDLQYVYDPQAASSVVANKAKTLCAENATVFAIERIGLDAETVAWALTQKTWTHKIKLGVQIISGDRTDDNGEYFITQPAVYTSVTGAVEGVVVA